MELYDAIMTRRSVRKFTDHYVTDEEIEKLLEAAQWAPSWKNSQCWEFIIIRDRELIKKLLILIQRLTLRENALKPRQH